MSVLVKEDKYCMTLDKEETVRAAKENYKTEGVFYLLKSSGAGGNHIFYVKNSDFNDNAIEKYNFVNGEWVKR